MPSADAPEHLQQQTTAPVPPAAHFPAQPTPASLPTATPVSLNGPVTIALSPDVPEEYATPLLTALIQIDSVTAANGVYPVRVLDQAPNADTQIRFAPLGLAQYPLAERFYAVVAPFAIHRRFHHAGGAAEPLAGAAGSDSAGEVLAPASTRAF